MRRDAGLTQRELADSARVSIGFVRDLEQGRFVRPRAELVGQVADVLKLDLTQRQALIASSSRPPPDPNGRAAGPDGFRKGALPLRVRILGPLMVVRNDEVQAGLSGASAALLGLLAMSVNRTVSRHAIVDALWGEDPPRSAIGIVHTYVSRLRSVLGTSARPDDGPLVRDRLGYRLDLDDDQLDVLQFRRLVEIARRARADGDAAQAYRAYEQALEFWRGEPLADIDILRGHPAVTALADELAAAVLEYADFAASGGGGWPDRVLPHLRALAARDRLDETSHARLMVALAAGGKQAEALRIYEDLRQRLDGQMGVLPGAEVREAHARILRQEIPGWGGLDHSAACWPVFQLPPAPADFTGRSAGCDKVIRAVTVSADHPGVPLVTISGPPGVGKTTLALYAAHKVRDQFPDGQLWVELAGSSARPREPSDVLGEVLRALGLSGPAIPDDFSERSVAYRSRLAGKRILVVVDDAATAAQVRLLTPGTAGCALLVTSRASLEGLDGARLVPLDVMTAGDAAGLLTRIVGPTRVGADPDAAADLVRACGSLPLALRIAGAKLAARPSWPLAAMVRRITGAHGRLSELQAGDLSVRASIASSYESLPERLRRAFRRLALLGPSDFAEWVTGALLGEPGACDVAGELAGRSLLTPLGVDATGEPRYRLHDLLRDYAAERLAEEPAAEKNEALERLVTAWLQLAQRANSHLPPEPYFPPPVGEPPVGVVSVDMADRLTADAIGWFTAERINLRTAVEQACQLGRVSLARQLAAAQCAFQYLQDRYDDADLIWRMISDAADRSGDHQGDAIYARLRVAASIVERGRAGDALADLTRCVEAAEQAGEPETLALALYWRAGCALDLGDLRQAGEDVVRGVSMARQAGSQVGDLNNLRALANVLAYNGEVDRAVAVSQEAVAVAAGLGSAPYHLAALGNLANSCMQAGQYDRVVSLSLQRIDLTREIGDVRGEGLARGVLGDAYQRMGEYELAAHCLLQAISLFQNQHAHRYHAVSLLKLGYAYEGLARYPEAISYLEQSMAMFRQLSLLHKVSEAQQALDRCQV
jgi:DNA-binding SARP family transcriptional activator